MAALFVYLTKVNVALIVFCIGYYLILRHLTFYTLNRVYLVFAILFSNLYPLVNLSGFISRHPHTVHPVQMMVYTWQAPVSTALHTAIQPDKPNWPEIILGAGLALFAIRFIFQIVSLCKLHKQSIPMQLQRYLVRAVTENINPFSFLKNIYINPKNHAPADLSVILEHEQVHINEWHSLDILLAELSIIFYWFNPGVWFLKKAIHENIEFITDQQILKNGSDPKTYQYGLLKANFYNYHYPIATHFNTSSIKKRIMMMNAERSSLFNLGRYLLFVPAIAIFLLFSVSKTSFGKQVSKAKQAITSVLKTAVATFEKPVPIAKIKPDNRQQIIVLSQATTDTSKKTEHLPEYYSPLHVFPGFSRIMETSWFSGQPDDPTYKGMPVNNANHYRDTSNVKLSLLDVRYYPDSIYVDGRYGDINELLHNLKREDVACVRVFYPGMESKAIAFVFTKNNKDYEPILDMDEMMGRRSYFIVNGKITTEEDMVRIQKNEIVQIRFGMTGADIRPSYPVIIVTTKD